MTFRAPAEVQARNDGATTPLDECPSCDAFIAHGRRFEYQCIHDMGPMEDMSYCPRVIQGPGVTSPPVIVSRPKKPPQTMVEPVKKSVKTKFDFEGKLRKRRRKRIDERQQTLFGGSETG